VDLSMAAADKPFLKAIVSHAFSPDRKQLAVAPNSEEVFIYDSPGQDPSKWEKKFILTEHEGFVSALDWGKAGLVTCGHDRNAYVWEYDAKEENFKPTLVVLRINRAATDVKWSPSGQKFGVASGAKCIPICHYEKSNNWWISKMIKKHKSTVTSLAWSPNSKFILSGCADFKARINSAYIEGLDPAEDDGFGEIFPKQHEFGETMVEFDTKGWVNAVAWAPGGRVVAFAAHSSTLTFVELKAGGAPVVNTLNLQGLPFLDIAFLDDGNLVGVGYDNNPALFKGSGSEWKFAEYVDKEQKAGAGAKKASAFAKWADADKRGAAMGDGAASLPELEPTTRHKNVITGLKVVSAKEFTTAGIDGRVLHWKLS
jgi:actin related protein 2/3 complex subunit 1A/1B